MKKSTGSPNQRAGKAASSRPAKASSSKPLRGMAKTKARPPLKPDPQTGVVLLTGGNPQIAKGDGDGPVQAYIAAMPGWKSDLGRQLDKLITKLVPNVKKAVRWNSPFYGTDEHGWFLSTHVLTKCVKVTFFAGLKLQPIPPGGTEKSRDARWIDICEEDGFDSEQLGRWIRQAASLPGWKMK